MPKRKRSPATQSQPSLPDTPPPQMKAARTIDDDGQPLLRPQHKASELLIVDNTDDDWKVHRYLHDWCDVARAFDIATAYFEIGALLALDTFVAAICAKE